MDGLNLTIHDLMSNFKNLTAVHLATFFFSWITFCIELPVICWAIFALYRLVKNDNVAPVYVINLLISDILQLIGRLGMAIKRKSQLAVFLVFFIYPFGLITSVVFMVCIALERYLVIVHPLWYRYRRTVRISVLISLAAWVTPLILPLISGIFVGFLRQLQYISIFFFIFLISPFPLLVFFLVATWRALSRSTSVPVTERKRILWILFLVLGNYTLLFFPAILFSLIGSVSSTHIFKLDLLDNICTALLFISPLMDAVLYIFMRKDANDTLKVLPCCQRLSGNHNHRQAATVGRENATGV